MPEEILLTSNEPTVTTDPFDGSPLPVEVKKDEPIVIQKKDEPIVIDKKDEPVLDKKDEPILVEDGRNFLKEKLGYEDWDAAKTELETLRTKAKTSEGYEPIDKKQIKELYALIDKKEKFESLTTGDITKENAVDIVKTAMREKYKFTDSQIDYRFNKQFGVPKEPIQGDIEEDAEFAIRQNEWKNQVANAEMELIIEATLARPELEKINSELTLPDIIQTEIAPRELTPEDLAKAQKGRELFVQDAESELKKFEGFGVTYKDKDVEVQSNYKPSDEENKNVLSAIKELAERGYDANVIFAKRWGKNGEFNLSQMVKDLTTLETADSRGQKYIGDAVAKAKLQYLKQKHNIDLDTGNGGGELQLEDKNSQKKNEDAIWN